MKPFTSTDHNDDNNKNNNTTTLTTNSSNSSSSNNNTGNNSINSNNKITVSSSSNHSNSSNSTPLMKQLQNTSLAVQELHMKLVPFINLLKQQQLPVQSQQHLIETTRRNELLNEKQLQSKHLHPHTTAVAQTVVALTVTTICYLQPNLLRCSTSNNNNTTITTTVIQKQKKQQQQVRTDLNHIRQLLKSIQQQKRPLINTKKRKSHTTTIEALSLPETTTATTATTNTQLSNINKNNANPRKKQKRILK